MRSHEECIRLTALLCTALLVPGDTLLMAQDQGMKDQSTQEKPTKVRTPDELDSLVAPIALYPDPLLAQVLAASTYPLEIVQASRWLAANKNLKGEELTKAAAKQPWDPSVQALVAFPDALTRLDKGLQWTTDLGNAFLDQPDDVMDAAQRMRKKAKDGGNLQSTKEQKVEVKTIENKSVIVIEPSNPQVVYVPSYNPTVVYGPPVYAYPPIYYPPPPSTGAIVATAAVSFGVGVMMGAFWGGCCGGGWGWGCGWGGHNNIYVNNNFHNRYGYNNISGGNRINNINGGNRVNNIGSGNRATQWQHNSDHRRSVPYSNRNTAQRFGGSVRDSSGQMQRFDRGAGQMRATSTQTGLNRGAQTSTRDMSASRGSRGSSLGGNQDRIGNRSINSGNASGQRSALSGESGARARASSDRGFSSTRESGGGSRSFGGGGGGGGRGGGGRRR